ncbi:MAG: hypothetical protein SWJ54_25230, partial [Cyanobacteriota bacterium]|nr:hypothetical protein [Cyanobacteriota bacterium]
MQQLLQPSRKLFILYISFVFITAFLLFLQNPTPWIREDLWGEDGRYYIASTINNGFWKALYLNFQHKGYLQFFKFFIATLCLGVNQILFPGEIIWIPRIIAITSYLIYALVFCLPIILFNRQIKVKYLIAIAVSSCFIDVGPLDGFLVFGRILNTGFLSIYLCFLLVIYRTLFIRQIQDSTSVIDLAIFL